jgi:hypothetical protein
MQSVAEAPRAARPQLASLAKAKPPAAAPARPMRKHRSEKPPKLAAAAVPPAATAPEPARVAHFESRIFTHDGVTERHTRIFVLGGELSAEQRAQLGAEIRLALARAEATEDGLGVAERDGRLVRGEASRIVIRKIN